MKNNKGKVVVLAIYLLLVILFPLIGLPFINRTTEIPQSLIPSDADQFSQQYISLLQKGDTTQAYSLLPQSVISQYNISTTSIQALANSLASTTNQIDIVGAQTTVNNSLKTSDLEYEIANNDQQIKYILVDVITSNAGNNVQLAGIYVQPETQSIKDQNKFNFATQWPELLLSLLIPLFIAYTAFRYIQKAQKPGWILFLVILLISVYATASTATSSTGASELSVRLGFGLYSFMEKSGLWGPLSFNMPIPLGAIYYYIVRKRSEKKLDITQQK